MSEMTDTVTELVREKDAALRRAQVVASWLTALVIRNADDKGVVRISRADLNALEGVNITPTVSKNGSIKLTIVRSE